mgnify:CR=1 FL=1
MTGSVCSPKPASFSLTLERVVRIHIYPSHTISSSPHPFFKYSFAHNLLPITDPARSSHFTILDASYVIFVGKVFFLTHLSILPSAFGRHYS